RPGDNDRRDRRRAQGGAADVLRVRDGPRALRPRAPGTRRRLPGRHRAAAAPGPAGHPRRGGLTVVPDYPQAITPVGHVEPVPRRVRALLGGRTVLDTTAARYVWEWPFYPQFYVPLADVAPGV